MSAFIGELPDILMPKGSIEDTSALYERLRKIQARSYRYLANYPRNDLKPATIIDYERKVRHLEAMLGAPIGSLSFGSIFALEWTSSASFHANRAALIYVCLCALRDGLDVLEIKEIQKRADACMRQVRMKNALRHLDEIAAVDPDDSQQKAYELQISEIKEREGASKSRRSNLRELNQLGDWLGDVWHVASKAEHAALIAVLILTGCRPVELLKGVRIRITDDGNGLVLRVLGAKVKEGDTSRTQTGQDWREIHVGLETEPARFLAAMVSDEAPILTVGADFKAGFVDRSRELRRLIAEIGEKALGQDVSLSPYDFRHAFSAYLKSVASIDAAEVAQAMGQRSTSSQTHYGTARQVGSSQRSPVIGVRAAHPVRIPKPPIWPSDFRPLR